jgi:hypothetical protein
MFVIVRTSLLFFYTICIVFEAGYKSLEPVFSEQLFHGTIAVIVWLRYFSSY